jgi:hypothetical protein
MKHTGVRIGVGILVLLLVLAGVGSALVWLKLASLKKQLAQNLGNALQAQVEVASINFDLWHGEIRAAGITLTNQRPDAPWDQGEISQAVVHFHLHDLLAPTLPLTLQVSSWKLVLHPNRASTGAAAAVSESGTAPAAPAAAPANGRVRVTGLSAQEGEVEIDLANGRQILLHGVSFDAAETGDVWTTQVQASSISSGPMQLDASSVEIRGEPGQLTFSNLRLACAQGIITGDGDLSLDAPHQADMNLKAVDVPVSMLVSVQWQMKLSGLANGTLRYKGNDQGAEAQGQLAIAGGKFNVLPFLGKMSAMIGFPDITDTEVDKATTDFDWKDGTLHLANIDIRKNDVIRIAGDASVDATSQVDGHLRLGLPDSILTKWAQLQSSVFPTQSDNYSWADVHLTGTPDHLQEDLSSRVLAAGVQSGGTLLNQGGQKAMDLLNSFLSPSTPSQ